MSVKNGNARFLGTVQPWRPRALVAGVIIVFLAVMWSLLYQVPREPAYRGKPLTLWLRTYASSSSSGFHSREWNEADDAVRHMGTNCIPILLHMIRQRDSNMKRWLMAFARRQELTKRIHFVPAAVRNDEASKAFIVLGDEAKDAVPALVKMYHDNITAESRGAIEDALAWIGPAAKPAIPLLVEAMTNANPRVRANASWALGEIHAEPQLCIPQLIHALSDSDDWARLSAAHALGMFGTNAKPAVSSLSELTNAARLLNGSFVSTRLQVMSEARNALVKINPPIVARLSETFPDFGIPLTDLTSSTNK